MKKLLTIICLFVMLILSACGSKTPGNSAADASVVPEKPEASIMIDPPAAPENTAPPAVEPTTPETDASAQMPNTEKATDESSQQKEAAPVQEARPPAPVRETQPVQDSVQNQQSASGQFTGVMGTVFVVPDGFTQLFENPNIGYQYTFWHPDYEIRIEVSEIAPGYLPEGAWEVDHNNASKNPDVTYFKDGENWFVDSGYHNNGEEVFYEKESSTDGILKSFRITYPTAKREFGDSVTSEFEKNCRF